MTGKEELPYKITYSKEAKEYIEKQKIEEYLDDFQNFIPNNLFNIYHNQLNDFILDKMSASIEIGIDVNKKVLDKWVDMCIKLDNMSTEQIEDIAIRHYIEKLEKRKDNEIAKYKKVIKFLEIYNEVFVDEIDDEKRYYLDGGWEPHRISKEEYELMNEVFESLKNT